MDEKDGRESRYKDIRKVKDIKKVKIDLIKPTKRYRKEQRKLLKEKNADIKPNELLKSIEKSWSQLAKPQKMKYIDSDRPGKPSSDRKQSAADPKKRSSKPDNPAETSEAKLRN